MKIELEQVSPHEIEKRSFEIITEELNGRTFPEDQELVVKRCIHTSADFDYADNLCFSEHAVAKGIEAIREGACIVTDTQMARSGINKKVLARHGGEALCFMSDEDVAAFQCLLQAFHHRGIQHDPPHIPERDQYREGKSDPRPIRSQTIL
jgi:precorrin-8X/cobalt-precorrin-8 methylmutase